MSDLVVCQPGWFAVFENVDGDGFSTEPIACWLRVPASGVHPVCALGSDVCDATTAANYVGVIGPSNKTEVLAEALVMSARKSREDDKRNA